jgi:ADP-heptose:LPS heptosyltransferase
VSSNVFVHHDGALGDVLLSLACIRVIRDNSDSVHMAGPPDVTHLLEEAGYVHGSSSPGGSLLTSLYTSKTEKETIAFLRHFDHAMLFTRGGDSPLMANIAKVIPRTTIIITIPPEGVRTHAAQFRLDQLAPGESAEDLYSKVVIPFPYREKGKALIVRYFSDRGRGPLIVLHPGSGGKRKCWPLNNYFSLAEKLLNRRACRILFLTGPAEEPEAADNILSFVQGHKGLVHVRNEPLLTVAGLLINSDLYVGNDSGITHLAAAVNARVVVLFGPTDPGVWKPLGTGVQVISAGITEGSFTGVDVDEVYGRLTSSLREY